MQHGRVPNYTKWVGGVNFAHLPLPYRLRMQIRTGAGFGYGGLIMERNGL